MIENERYNFFSILEDRINECLCLSISQEDRRRVIKNWVIRLISDLEKNAEATNEIDEIKTNFSHFVGIILSILDGLGLEEKSQKAVRKLLLNEIYSCQNAFIAIFDAENKVGSAIRNE